MSDSSSFEDVIIPNRVSLSGKKRVFAHSSDSTESIAQTHWDGLLQAQAYAEELAIAGQQKYECQLIESNNFAGGMQSKT